MEVPKTLFCSSKFSWARGMISSKFVGYLGTCLPKGWPALFYDPYCDKKRSLSLIIEAYAVSET
jgi:hypothetical protein